MLKLMYITNEVNIAKIAQAAGVDRIFIDMEYIGKDKRQNGMNTVKNHHTVEDVKNIRRVLDKSDLLVRVNPIHDGTADEINEVVDAGADIIMLPMWKSVDDVKTFIDCVDSRAKTMLLLETKEALECLDDVLKIQGIDEIHIGLNDLHLSLGKRFLFELLADNTVDDIVKRISKTQIPYGFGGFGALGGGLLNADYIVSEHYRLGSSMAILSRAFCDTSMIKDENEIQKIFFDGVSAIREFEGYLCSCNDDYFIGNHNALCRCVDEIVRRKSGCIKHSKDFATL